MLALRYIDDIPVFHRPPLLEAAAELISDGRISACCRAQATCIRHAELNQLEILKLLEGVK